MTMAKFFVGQRVRLARPVHPENLGLTGRIREFIEPLPSINGGKVDCCVDWDNGDRDGFTRGKNGLIVRTDSGRLEPILDRHEPCESEFKESLDKLLSEVSREAA
jgi:hypothetical protein